MTYRKQHSSRSKSNLKRKEEIGFCIFATAMMSSYMNRQRYEEMLAYQKEYRDIARANKHENPMVSIRAIDSLHSITNDIARVIDVIPYVAGGNSATSKQFLPPPVNKDYEIVV